MLDFLLLLRKRLAYNARLPRASPPPTPGGACHPAPFPFYNFIGQTGWVPALQFLHTILSSRVPAVYFLQDGRFQAKRGGFPHSIFHTQSCPAGFPQSIFYKTDASRPNGVGSRTLFFAHNPVQQGSRSLFFTRRKHPAGFRYSIFHNKNVSTKVSCGGVHAPALHFYSTSLSSRVPAMYCLQDGSVQQGSGTPCFTAQACPAGFRQRIFYRTGTSNRVPALHYLQHRPAQ